MIWPAPSHAQHTVSLALGGIEEGDERYRPEWIVRFLWNGRYFSELHLYGRIQGRIRQSTQMFTLGFNNPLFGSRYLAAHIGGAVTRDETVIRSVDPDVATRSSQAYNVGAYFGLGLQTSGTISFSLDWNNAQFLAGTAGIFLATARKQNLSLGVGWRI